MIAREPEGVAHSRAAIPKIWLKSWGFCAQVRFMIIVRISGDAISVLPADWEPTASRASAAKPH